MDESKLSDIFAISPLMDLEIDVGGLGLVGLSARVNHETRIDVTSAVIMQVLSCSFPTAKKYTKDTPEHVPRDKIARDLCEAHIAAQNAFYENITPRENAPIGVFAFDIAMVRSQESIKLLLAMARQGFLIEPALLSRSLLEQFAYAAFVWDKEDEKCLFKSRPQSLLASLNSIVPSAGRAYGFLSRLAHYDPNLHFNFLQGQAEPEDRSIGTSVVQRSWKFKILSLAWLFFILDCRQKIFKNYYGPHESYVHISHLDGITITYFDELFSKVQLKGVNAIRQLF